MIKRIPQKNLINFSETLCIQENFENSSFNYGLFFDDELIAVSTFGKPRYNRNFDYEWIRYAVRKGYRIHGGPQKMFSKFLEDSSAESVISYIDFNHTTRKTFLDSIGFILEEIGSPSLVWNRIRDNKVVPQSSINMIGADRLFGTNYGSMEESGMNNEDIMLKEGFLKVYTSGNLTYTWKI